jgi:hypothetical protein
MLISKRDAFRYEKSPPAKTRGAPFAGEPRGDRALSVGHSRTGTDRARGSAWVRDAHRRRSPPSAPR